MSADLLFSRNQVEQFNQQGYVIEKSLAGPETCSRMLRVIREIMEPPLAPVEFETDVQYPGSPTDRLSPGGNTPRRFLNAYTRDAIFRQWARDPRVVKRIQQLLDTDQVLVSQNHHNCIMTKHPGFSSATLWHQDIRYWLFDQPNLVSVWLALTDENEDNGGLQLIPGSHRLHIDRGRFDGALFLRQDLPGNQAMIHSAVAAELHRGDALFFHSRTLHAAGRNNTDDIKTSLVFTYHAENNQPLAGTRSAAYPDIACTGN